MKKFFSRLPKKLLAALATAVVLIGVAGAANAAFGPDRPTLTWTGNDTKGADHVVFNSFVNNPVWGDERDFVRGGVNQRDDKFSDPVANVKEGDVINVVVFVHNNADTSLNNGEDGQNSGTGVARNTTVKAELPSSIAKTQEIKTTITADNATPKAVFDTVGVNSLSNFSMQYVPGSVHIRGNHIDKDVPTADITAGFKIGDALDGVVPGCFDHVQYVTFKVKVGTPGISIEKTERKLGDTAWVKDMTVTPGDTIEYRLKIKDVGQSDLTNVSVGDRLPPYLDYVKGSTKIYNSLVPNGETLNDGIVPGAIVLNNNTFVPTSSAFIVFQAKVNETIKDKECGSPRLRNIAATHADQVPQDVEDYADVVVNTGKTCVQPTYSCDMLTSKLVSGRNYELTAKASATKATIKGYTYDFGDKTEKLVTDKAVVEHTYASAGSYKANVTVTFTVDGTDKTATSDKCAVTITVPETPTTTTSELPSTGTGSMIGIFFGSSAIAGIGYNLVARRRALR